MYVNLISRVRSFALALFIGFYLCHSSLARSQDSSELAGFAAVWKLMSAADRERFISGYLRGWKDASEFLDIANEYVRNNPTQAPDALAKLKTLANLGDQKPAPLAIFIDRFYKNPDNQNAPLSKAVSAARGASMEQDSEGDIAP